MGPTERWYFITQPFYLSDDARRAYLSTYKRDIHLAGEDRPGLFATRSYAVHVFGFYCALLIDAGSNVMLGLLADAWLGLAALLVLDVLIAAAHAKAGEHVQLARLVVVLCDIDGKSHSEDADHARGRRLGWSIVRYALAALLVTMSIVKGLVFHAAGTAAEMPAALVLLVAALAAICSILHLTCTGPALRAWLLGRQVLRGRRAWSKDGNPTVPPLERPVAPDPAALASPVPLQLAEVTTATGNSGLKQTAPGQFVLWAKAHPFDDELTELARRQPDDVARAFLVREGLRFQMSVLMSKR